MDYIDRIRALRKAQGLTQKDMADVLGVATSMLTCMKHGSVGCMWKLLQRCAVISACLQMIC